MSDPPNALQGSPTYGDITIDTGRAEEVRTIKAAGTAASTPTVTVAPVKVGRRPHRNVTDPMSAATWNHGRASYSPEFSPQNCG